MMTNRNITIVKLQPKMDLSATGRLGPGLEEIIFKKDQDYYFISRQDKRNMVGICEVKEIYSMNKKELTEASDIVSDWCVIYIKPLHECDDLDEVSKKRLEKLAREWNLYEIGDEYE